MDAAATPETRDAVVSTLTSLAPEVDPAALADDRPLREQVDFDSLDWLNLLDALGERLGVSLPASRVGPRTTLAQLVALAAAAREATTRKRRTRVPAVPRTLRLTRGRRVVLRPIVPADAPMEAAFVRNLSAESRYKRFMGGLRELTPAKLKYFTDVDQVTHIALVATTCGPGGEAIVGVARCVVDASGAGGDFAIVVADDWQGSGLAGALMHALIRAARDLGLREIGSSVLASNRRMLRLARQLGFQVQSQPGEAGTVRVWRAL